MKKFLKNAATVAATIGVIGSIAGQVTGQLSPEVGNNVLLGSAIAAIIGESASKIAEQLKTANQNRKAKKARVRTARR